MTSLRLLWTNQTRPGLYLTKEHGGAVLWGTAPIEKLDLKVAGKGRVGIR